MKIALNKIIRNLLLERGKLHLPGIGVFVLQRQPAIFRVNENQVYPPTYDLVLQPSTNENDSTLADYIEKRIGLSQKEAQQTIINYVSQITASLSSKQSFNIEGIGDLFMNDGTVSFAPDQTTKGWFHEHLIPLTPQYVKKSTTEDINTSRSNVKYSDYSSRILPLLFLLVLFTLSIKHYLNQKEWSSNHIINQEQSIPEEDKNEAIAPDRQPDTENSNHATTNKDTCIIITGYFTKAKNSLKMLNKLRDNGYQGYVEQVADGERVGIIFDCTNMDLRQNIYKIRKEIAKDAWYLQPQITVE